MRNQQRRRVGRILCGLAAAVAVSRVPVQAGLSAPPFEVPYGRRMTAVVTPAEGERYLRVNARFHSPQRRFDRREAGITVNGTILPSTALASAADVLQPRTDSPRFARVDDERQIIWFPWTHREGGLNDYDLVADNQARLYQLWVPQFRDFNETVIIDLAAFAPRADGSYAITFYNNAGHPLGRVDGRESGPPLSVTEVRPVRELPDLDRGVYTAPIWPVLATDAELEREALQRLDDDATDPVLRAQLALQVALEAAFRGDTATATERLRLAAATTHPYPEHNEARYRLAIREPDGAPESLDEADDIFGWARLFNRWRTARAGGHDAAIIDVFPIADAALDVPAVTAAMLWEAANGQPLSHQVLGPAIEGPAANTVVFGFSDEGLLLAVRGPGSELLRPRNIPGRDRPVWEYNCIELFLSPGADILEYFELNVSSVNARFDGRHRYHRQTDADWDGDWESGAAVRDGVMEVVMRVPWADLGQAGPPEPGTLWVANVIRVQHLPAAEGGWKVAEFSLGPLGARDFHRLQDGVILRFR